MHVNPDDCFLLHSKHSMTSDTKESLYTTQKKCLEADTLNHKHLAMIDRLSFYVSPSADSTHFSEFSLWQHAKDSL